MFEFILGGDHLDVLTGFGGRLKQAVKESPYTQKQLSEIILINQDTFTNYVKGKSFPDIKILLELCQLLNKTPDWLLTGEEPLQENPPVKEQANYQTDELWPLADDERNMLLKYRLFDDRDQYDVKEMIDIKYNRMVKRGKSCGSRNGGGKKSRKEASTKEYA